MAGIWSIWSISFVWFDEQERQDRPAHQIDCPGVVVLRFVARDASLVARPSFPEYEVRAFLPAINHTRSAISSLPRRLNSRLVWKESNGKKSRQTHTNSG